MGANSKTARVLLASAAQTGSVDTPVQQDEFARAARLYLTVTAASGTGGLQVLFRGYDRVPGPNSYPGEGGNPTIYTGAWCHLSAGGAPVTQPGTYCYELSAFGGVPRGNVMDVTQCQLPYLWGARVVALDGSSYTYSLSAETA